MKSNQERVKSILDKAKKYKQHKNKMFITITCMLCICGISSIRFLNFNSKQKNNSANAMSNLKIEMEDAYVDNIYTFNSKEELINMLNDRKEVLKNSVPKKYFIADDLGDFSSASGIVQESFAINENAIQPASDLDMQYSKTNLQEKEVDESDIIKTNGKNIYYLSSKDKILRIFNIESEQIILEKEVKYSDKDYAYNPQIYLDDKYFIIIFNSDASIESGEMKHLANVTKVLIYDVNTNELLRDIECEGSILSSRKIGNDLYIVTNKYLSLYSETYNDEIIPIYKDSCISSKYEEVPIEKINYFKDFDDDESCNYMIITSLNLDNINNELNINTFLGAGNEIYCSENNLYVTKTTYQYSDNIDSENAGYALRTRPIVDVETNIHKFEINNGTIKYISTGKVDGSLLNQFSMDEYNGYFRIATSNENMSGNNLYVLDKNLKQVGSIENLASGEKIYSVRFMADKAYVVTYKTVDPLFVIDLSVPNAPKVLGELKIPGYSSYLHPFGENYLIGFGEDSIEKSYINWEGESEVTAYSTGLKLAIFDVSDYNNPKELHSIKIGYRGSYSDLLYNHKALLFDEEKGIIAFPASVAEDAGYYDDGIPKYGDIIFNGALVYDFSVEDGFSLRGKLNNGKNENIDRIIYVGDKFYTASRNFIKSWNMETTEEIDSLKF